MESGPLVGQVLAVSRDGGHRFSKPGQEQIALVAGLGVEGDAHAGTTVKHRFAAAATPDAPNLRQVHLIHSELHAELADRGFDVGSGQMGENVTTSGLDLLGLPRGTRLHLGPSAVVEVTGLRNPCYQLNSLAPGLMKAVLHRAEDGRVVRKAGIMGVVVAGGEIRAGDRIDVELPPPPHAALGVV